MSGDSKKQLRLKLERIRANEAHIYVRENIDGTMRSVPLNTVSPERWAHHVAEWLIQEELENEG